MIRGDAAATSLFAHASALIKPLGIASDAELGPFLETPPAEAGEEMLRQLRYMYDAGGWVLFESAVADLPSDLRWLFESGAVTIEQLATLHEALGATSATDLAMELRRHSIRAIPGLGESVESAIAAALPTLRAAIARIPLGRAVAIADPVLARLREAPGITWVEPVGSLRRGQDLVGDIEIVAPAADPGPVFEHLLGLDDVATVLHRSQRRIYLLMDRVQIGVRCPPFETAGATLLLLTGSAAHIEALTEFAQARGLVLDATGVGSADSPVRIAESEESMYAAMGLPWIPPEIRNGDTEIDAAAAGTLPALVSRQDIRGDLHMHTQWSDGRDTTETMVQTCVGLGYEYMAITDHSTRAAASRTLNADSVKKQAEEIAKLRERFPAITILHGCEVDILADGRLDFSDRILERFDIVLASLHERLGHEPAQLLQRYIAAMRHPLVTTITHPTNRILPHRKGYDLDWDTFFSVAVETKTVVEIDGAPPHLDMNGALARRAIAGGVTVSIDSDCHRAELLDRQMTLGVATARRGWVEARHVINTRTIAGVRSVIAAKRQR